MSDVFISYNREDMAFAQRFLHALQAEGVDVWWDQSLRAGQTYDEVTEAALRGAKAVVVLWSPRSVVSRWVRAEATLADRNKTLLPVMIEPCERPIMFELTQTADLSGWSGLADDPVWRQVVHDVRHFIERGGGPTGEVAAPQPAPAQTPLTGERGGAPSLAVLPFTNRSGLPEDDAFAFGMVEDVIDALAEGVNLRVIASSTTARFRSGPMPDLEAMGRQLGVRYFLEGNVRRAGDSLRVTAQLVEAAGGAIVWSQKFERHLDELADLQGELVSEVAASLGANIYKIEMNRALKKPSDLTAWECVARALAAIREVSGESLILGITEAQRAVAIAPDYALAHAILAQMTSGAYFLVGLPDGGQEQMMQGHIDRAYVLDPDHAGVLAAIATASAYLCRPTDGIGRAERAIRLRPGHGLAHYAAGIARVLLGHERQGISHLQDFLRAEPESHLHFVTHSWIGIAHMRLAEWDAARDAFARSHLLVPGNFVSHMMLMGIDHREADDKSASQHLRTALQTDAQPSKELYRTRFERFFTGSPLLGEMLGALDALWPETLP